MANVEAPRIVSERVELTHIRPPYPDDTQADLTFVDWRQGIEVTVNLAIRAGWEEYYCRPNGFRLVLEPNTQTTTASPSALLGAGQDSVEWPEEFACPHCGIATAVDDDYRSIICPDCGEVIPKASVAVAPPPAPEEEG